MAKKKKESPAAKSQRAITTFFPASPVKNKSGPQKSTTGNAERKKKPAKDPEFPLQKTKVKKNIETNDYENSVFVVGTVVDYDDNKDSYTVELENQDGSTATEKWTSNRVAQGQKLFEIADAKVARDFDGEIYQGRVVDVSRDEADGTILIHILYGDGDEEDYDEAELEEGQDMYKREFASKPKRKRASKSSRNNGSSSSNNKNNKKVPTKESTKKDVEPMEEEPEEVDNGKKRSRRRRKVNYNEDAMMDLLNTDEEEEEERKPPAKKQKAFQKKRKSRMDDDEDDEFEMDEAFDADSDEDDDDDDLDAEILVDEEEEEEEEEEVKPKKSRKKAPAKRTAASKKKSARKESDSDEEEADDNINSTDGEYDAEYRKKLAKDRASFKPNNNPQKWPKDAFVEPVGVDPTHGIVEGIILNQVKKVGKLLALVAKNEKDKVKGEISFPIQLQTACSGTDAPSIALGLVEEALNKLYSKEEHGFQYSHVMSCEIEAFKQAYIGRNFPGVPLFPDITKLTDGEFVEDVYGRKQRVPQGNLFIAGTSCKDFSMLKNSDRKDIEDKGTSGETFLAAVELLDAHERPCAIFENVDGAPWGKMQEYIQGRLYLPDRNVTKAIKEASKKADADKELKFSVNKEGRYVAEVIPRQVGIRAGSIVEGFVRDGHDASEVEPLVSDEKNIKEITLGQMAKKHNINLNADTLVMEKKYRYCTHLSKLDTKDYGLPQTRNRKYLYIWRSDDPDDDLGDYFQELLDYLKQNLLHSMNAFLLDDTHDRIRSFREALRSGPGLLMKKDRARELDFWDWNISRVKDMTLHKVFREKNGIADRSRWLTGWDTRGRKEFAPGLWPELLDCWNMRRLDMIDCFGAAAIRDTIGRDPLHHSYTWDISQNVTRAPVRSATCGVSACVTPGGELILPHKGRTVMGYEKLLLQGIPFSRLLLGPETEVQLSDLAGNAMSVPVVCATMLAAICAPELRRQREKSRKVLLTNFALSQEYDEAHGAVLAQRGDLYNQNKDYNAKGFVEIFADIAKTLAVDAFRSSALCTCETSGRTTEDTKILECTGCGMRVCHLCSGRCRVSSHSLKEIDVSSEENPRPDSHVFERKLRCAVPSILQFGENLEDYLENGKGLGSYSFQLQQVDRKSGFWLLVYGAWEDRGSGRQVAEIRVHIGKTTVLDTSVGVAAFIRCFAPAIRSDKPFRGKLKDSARLILKIDDCSEGMPLWQVPDKSTSVTLELVGSDLVDSQRVLAGLNDEAYKGLKAHKVQKSFQPPVDSRNNLLSYHKQWKTWPGTIAVSGDPLLSGTYKKCGCTHTVVLSALWRREDEGGPPMYLFYRPDVLRTKLDVAVFSPTPSYRDNMDVCELYDWIPENCLEKSAHKTKAKLLQWKPLPENLKIEVPSKSSMSMVAQSKSFHERVCASSHQNSGQVLCEMTGLSDELIASLLEYNDNAKAATLVELDLVGRSGTRNAKRLSIIAAPSLLKSAAEDRLPLKLSKWYKLKTPSSSGFGHCRNNVPLRPEEKWQISSGDKGKLVTVRFYDAQESKDYYFALMNRPKAFEVKVDKLKRTLSVEMNPYVAAHRAAVHLVNNDMGQVVDVDYQLAELSSMGEPLAKPFAVPNSDTYEETPVDLVHPLYKRQAKALTRMLAIENGDIPFAEEERSEIVLPGIGWCLIAKASKVSRLRGGVLGDAIGSGKTVVTVALIMKNIEKARANCDIMNGRSGATLIVVPPGLVRQWDDERQKFTKDKLKSITIDSTASLKKYSVEDICKADMVIVPAGLIEEATKVGKGRPYTEHLSKKAGAEPIPPAPSSYSQREAPTIEGTWIRNQASGPEIFVGNKGDQKKRDLQAYYGYCYSSAISKLRELTFRPNERGVPLEWFTWERLVVDECHETLVTGKSHEVKDADFKEKQRRGAREFLGVAQTNPAWRPLVSANVWGLTGTPLLETEARVTELANLMGGTYVTGAAHHWRKEERDSGRDMFLNLQEGNRSRDYRCAVQEACHSYVREACQRNRGEKLQVKLTRKQCVANMSQSDGEALLKLTSDVDSQSFAVVPEQLGDKTGQVLSVTASSKHRQAAFLEAIDSIQQAEPDTKIVVFASTDYGGYESALAALTASGKKFCHVSDENNSVQEQNEIISWFRHVDVTDEEKRRARILLLSFEQAAGHNLQEAVHHCILYEPHYSGTDAVADASVEEQAIGRVMRQGQKYDVTVHRLILRGPQGERCLDDWIVERNLDEDVLRAATSNFD